MTHPVRRTTLPNGARIWTRHLPQRRSAALGLWLLSGPRFEAPGEAGWSHLLEHLFFKGSRRFDARTLARDFEAMGGLVNAQTGRELTLLHGTVAADDLTALTERLLDMVLAPAFNAADLAVERDVVRQEMAAAEDDPEDIAEETAIAAAWADHPLARPILGTPTSLAAATAPAMHRFLETLRCGQRLWVTAAGDVDHDALVRACAPLADLPAGAAPPQAPPRFHGGIHEHGGPGNQTHLLWLMPAPGVARPPAPEWALANHMLGGGGSSRLFEEIRERRGLAYHVQSHLERYGDGGLWAIHTACAPGRSEDCRRAVARCLADLATALPKAEELTTAVRHLRTDWLLEEDDADAVMMRLGHECRHFSAPTTLAERLAALDRVTPAQVQAVFGQALPHQMHLTQRPAED